MTTQPPPPAGRSPRTHPPRRLVDKHGAAEYLATTPRHIEKLRYERRIPSTKVGYLVRYDLDELDVWLEANHTDAS